VAILGCLDSFLKVGEVVIRAREEFTGTGDPYASGLEILLAALREIVIYVHLLHLGWQLGELGWVAPGLAVLDQVFHAQLLLDFLLSTVFSATRVSEFFGR